MSGGLSSPDGAPWFVATFEVVVVVDDVPVGAPAASGVGVVVDVPVVVDVVVGIAAPEAADSVDDAVGVPLIAAAMLDFKPASGICPDSAAFNWSSSAL